MLNVQAIDPNDFIRPTKAEPGSAGFDCYAHESVTLEVGARAAVKLGFRTIFDSSWVVFVCPRSGLALNKGLTVLNAPGIIDSSYRDELKAILINLGTEAVTINKGDRVCQLVMCPTLPIPVVTVIPDGVTLESTTRTGGFGSTGS